MERECRHSKEEEEELDRKIAQIREKNQKIVERRKEIDAELAIHSDELLRKPSKPSPIPSVTTKTTKGGWDREWDKGKTPAETWRENVPSMEIRRNPPGRGGSHQRGAQRGQRGGQKFRTTSHRTSENTITPQMTKGSRLEGRVSGLPFEANSYSRRGRGSGGARAQQNRRTTTTSNGELKVNVKVQNENTLKDQTTQSMQHRNTRKDQTTQSMQHRNTRKGARTSTNKGDSTKKSTTNQKQSRSADKYEIKRLLRKLVNKVEQLERKERQQKRKASNETKTATPEAEPKLEHYTNSEVTPESIDAKPTSKSIEADVVTNTKKSSESTKRADANQNIIKLVEEKVLQIQMS
ncbi:hypothetical protein Angca_001570 [Angiostrongylus cantonensis]|nr:hypothetical protein Angca_001570 [Angiostrongylus cantonensis]